MYNCTCTRIQYTIPENRKLTLWLYSTENEIATVQAAGERDVDVAVRAAREALKHPSWKLLPVAERGILLSKLADLIEENRELFATIDAWDNGEHQPFSFPSIFFSKLVTPRIKQN